MGSMSSMESMELVVSYSFYGYKSGFADVGMPMHDMVDLISIVQKH